MLQTLYLTAVNIAKQVFACSLRVIIEGAVMRIAAFGGIGLFV